MTERIQLSRAKGWKMPPNTVKVDRSTPWGNPFITGQDGTQRECVRLYVLMLMGLICLSKGGPDRQKQAHAHISKNKRELRGKNLACWCRIGTPCHADVLLLLANNNKKTASREILAYVESWFKGAK